MQKVIHLDAANEDDLAFFLDVFGEAALKKGWARERDRLYTFEEKISEDAINRIFIDPAPLSILDVPLPPVPQGALIRPLFTMPDGTEAVWIRHPAALPEGCHPHWRDHMLHFQFTNHALGFEAHHSVHRLAIVEAADGLPRMFAPGGVRWVDYPCRADMISDALDMSLAVAMKIEVVHTPSAGSKIAIMGDKKRMPETLASLYAALERMGLSITAADLGLSTEDLDTWAVPVAPTSCVPVGVFRDGMASSSITADGVAEGLFAMVETLAGAPDAKAVTVSMQGIGEVGYALAGRLLDRGINIVVAEINPSTIARFQAEFAPALATGQARILENPMHIYDVAADIFCPCALRDVLDATTLPRLKDAGVKMIGGPANNIFADQIEGPWLFQNAGLLVVPYEGIGAGGVTGVAQAIMTGIFGQCPFDPAEKIKIIGLYVAKIIRWARAYDIPAQVASDRILFNGVRRRTLLNHAQIHVFMEQLAEAYTLGNTYETVMVSRWTKKGFFSGAGKYPEGGWRYV